jgi:hypothetical protein
MAVRATDRTVSNARKSVAPYEMVFEMATIKHLGLQMYSTLPPVIGELVANAWDANAREVRITIPEAASEDAEIVVDDDGDGMTDAQIREAYLVVGRDRREAEGTDRTRGDLDRPLMGRKGIGKFAGFGIAAEVEIESVRDGETSRFVINYADLVTAAAKRHISFPPMPPSGNVHKGTRITLRGLTKFKNRAISIPALRRGLARRFAVIGTKYKFNVVINGKPITPSERDLKRLLDVDEDGNKYLWEFNEEIRPGTGWQVSGWIGALDRTAELEDPIQRGIVIMARGKLVQEPFVFNATVGQQYALSYLVGELNAEFVDTEEDSIGTTRNSLVWDTDANAALMAWGQAMVNRIAREWAEKRRDDNERALKRNALYKKFLADANRLENKRAIKIADRLIRQVITNNVLDSVEKQQEVVQLCIDYLEFDAFWDLAEEITEAGLQDTGKVAQLFREWEIVEAREMARLTKGRITTIEKLEMLIKENALEVPTLHNFLKEFPWVLDHRWQLIADEQRYSKLLREKFPDAKEPEEERRIDFLCVAEGTHLVVVEIKRPGLKASTKQLEQIERYVLFMRDFAENTTDPQLKRRHVVGYLLCGDLVGTGIVRQKRNSLEKDEIYVRRYSDLLAMVERSHQEFLERYDQLRKAKLARQ